MGCYWRELRSNSSMSDACGDLSAIRAFGFVVVLRAPNLPGSVKDMGYRVSYLNLIARFIPARDNMIRLNVLSYLYSENRSICPELLRIYFS